jgi:tricorn protease
VEPDAKAKEPVTAGMLARIDPRREWRQLFDDTWRLFRDYFYDPGMHGVDWKAVHDRYAALLPSCAARSDLSFLIRQMIGELNVGHARYNDPPEDGNGGPGVGVLGVDLELADGAYRFATIYRGPAWEPGLHSPLLAPGVDVREGDYLLAVNGVPVDPEQDPWAPFVGLEDQEVVLTVGPSPERDEAVRDVVVKTRSHSWERKLRYRAWVEANRRHVLEASDGRVGYVHLPSYVTEGLNMLITQYFPQQGMEAMIIDQRFNGGGWTPHRFLEILNRPAIGYRARRDGQDRPVPAQAHFGPKCLLMNEHSGSSGDMFPWMFRDAGLGPLIGRRTWGGVVGLSGNPGLIDGSQPVVPNNGTYSVDGEWVVEGWGVEPDIAVPDRPVHATDVPDATLEVAVATMLEALERPHHETPEPPAGPDRSGMGVPEHER